MNKLRFLYLILSLFLAICFITCGKGNKKLSRDKMEDILYDMQLVDAIYQNKYDDFKDAENKKALLDGVFLKHGITQADLDSSLVWYADHPEEFLRISDSVSARLKRESLVLEKNMPAIKANKINGSLLPYYIYLTEANPYLSFDIDSIKAKDYTKMEISLKSLGVSENASAELTVRFEYTDTVVIKRQTFQDKIIPKILNPNISSSIKDISGYIHVNTSQMDYKILLYDIELKGEEELKKDIVRPDSTQIRK